MQRLFNKFKEPFIVRHAFHVNVIMLDWLLTVRSYSFSKLHFTF